MKESDFRISMAGKLVRIPEGVMAFIPDPQSFDQTDTCQIDGRRSRRR